MKVKFQSPIVLVRRQNSNILNPPFKLRRSSRIEQWKQVKEELKMNVDDLENEIHNFTEEIDNYITETVETAADVLNEELGEFESKYEEYVEAVEERILTEIDEVENVARELLEKSIAWAENELEKDPKKRIEPILPKFEKLRNEIEYDLSWLNIASAVEKEVDGIEAEIYNREDKLEDEEEEEEE